MTNIHLPHSIPLKIPFSPYRNFNNIKPILITNKGAKLTDYSIKIELNQTNFPFEKIRNDANDLRFVDGNGSELSYFLESISKTSKTATIWCRIPEIFETGNKQIWMIYSNPAGSSGSNGVNTFEFFDDFEDGDVSDWTLASGSCNGGASLSADTESKYGTYALKVYGAHSGGWATPWAEAYQNINLSAGGKVVEFWHKSAVCGSYPIKNSIWIDDVAKYGPTCPDTIYIHSSTSSFTNSGTVKLSLRIQKYCFNAGLSGRFDRVIVRQYLTNIPTITIL